MTCHVANVDSNGRKLQARLANTPIYVPLLTSVLVLTVFEDSRGAHRQALARPARDSSLVASALLQVTPGSAGRAITCLAAWLALIALVGLVSPARRGDLALIVAVPILRPLLRTRTRLAFRGRRLTSTANAVGAVLFLVAVVGLASGGALDPSPARPAKGLASVALTSSSSFLMDIRGPTRWSAASTSTTVRFSTGWPRRLRRGRALAIELQHDDAHPCVDDECHARRCLDARAAN